MQTSINQMKYLTTNPIQIEKALQNVSLQSSGAMVIFTGHVRDHSKDKQGNIKNVKALEYTAFEPLANQLIDSILNDAKEQFHLTDAYCLHRLGYLNLEEIAVIIITTAKHRKECYKANQYIIDRVKHEVPIWKKEFFTDGTIEWSEGCIHEH
ncbi:MAG: molybdenum cofactor biosynthesis protein MoaE [Leptospiraceae bacterium]|nr:MAG: molybdenum cofactor biosynthesis protein MoaE [Leptospiraceae bacterium]